MLENLALYSYPEKNVQTCLFIRFSTGSFLIMVHFKGLCHENCFQSETVEGYTKLY